jgi:hypothetical protein
VVARGTFGNVNAILAVPADGPGRPTRGQRGTLAAGH